ncbi:MAG: hypothetical protein AMK74_00100 [Nitrospira bacterium SM23_35]|nr:MAG: hypothetical protein AMK74_00100 [Nitrospira bacterium SM23_35]
MHNNVLGLHQDVNSKYPASPILRVIGKNGSAILIRIQGMILAALSVELVLEALGVERWVSGIS